MDPTIKRPEEAESEAEEREHHHGYQYSFADQSSYPYQDLPRLTVTDGFRFGCGFMLAAAAAYFAALIAITLFVIFARIAGVSIPFLSGS